MLISTRSKLAVLKDFFHFLIFLMTDELCFLNLRIRDCAATYETFEMDSRSQQVLKKMVVNIMIGRYWVDPSWLKQFIDILVKNDHEIDQILPQITIMDDKTHKVRLKEELNQEFDPYIFFKAPFLHDEIVNELTSNPSQSIKVDLVSGKYDPDYPRHLVDVQIKLFQGALPNFLSTLIRSFDPQLANVIRPALKLILLHLQLVSNLSIKPEFKNSRMLLRQKITENYLTAEFDAGLEQIAKLESFKDCETCIKTIRSLLVERADNSPEFKPNEKMDLEETGAAGKEVESPAQAKKRKALEKMQKMKEEFAKKQALFANTNNLAGEGEETKIQEEVSSPLKEEEEEEIVCQHCLGKISRQGEPYGVPIYITFTNNLYEQNNETPAFKELDYSDVQTVNWWPVVSSCNHYYHKDCYNITYLKSMKVFKTGYSQFLTIHEHSCTLCKNLCNSFLPISLQQEETEQEKINKQKMLETEQKIYTDELFLSLEQRLMTVFKDFIQRVAFSASQKENSTKNVLVSDMLKRAYDYVLRNSSLYERPQTLEATLKLYSHFIRALQYSVNQSDKKEAQPLSVLTRLLESAGIDSSASSTIVYTKLTQELIKQRPELITIEVCMDILSKSFEEGASLKDSNSLRDLYSGVLKELLLLTISQLNTPSEQKLSALEDMISYYSKDTNANVILANNVAPMVQRISTAYLLNKSILHNGPIAEDGYELLCKVSNDVKDGESVNQILNSVGFASNIGALLQECLLDVGSGPNSKAIRSALTLLIEAKKVDGHQLLKTTALIPHMVELPDDFSEFSNMYYRRTCGQCNKYNNFLYVCLLCDQVICLQFCSPKDNKLGNLNEHVQKYHFGSGVLLSIHYNHVVIINALSNVIDTSRKIYTDGLGQTISNFRYSDKDVLRALDFKRFKLDEVSWQNIKDIIKFNNMEKEIFSILRISGKSNRPGNL